MTFGSYRLFLCPPGSFGVNDLRRAVFGGVAGGLLHRGHRLNSHLCQAVGVHLENRRAGGGAQAAADAAGLDRNVHGPSLLAFFGGAGRPRTKSMGGGSACDSPALCFAAGLWYNRKKRRKGRCAVYEMAQMQLTVYDFVQPFGGVLDEENRWVHLAKKIDWLKEKISFRLMILVSIVITILVVFMQNVVFYSSFLEAVFGKDATFTGRTTLWAQALIRIAANPFIGGGHISEGDTSFLFGKEDIWFGVSCHNIYLDTAVETGLLGLALYLIILLYIGRKVDEYSQREKTALFASLYLIFFIACNFEIYLNGGQSIYLFPPLMFLYLSFDQ